MSAFISNRKRKQIDNDYAPSEVNWNGNKRQYSTRSSKRVQMQPEISNFAVDADVMLKLPEELRAMTSQYSFKAAYLLNCPNKTRPRSLKMTLVMYRTLNRILHPVLTFYYDTKWYITMIEDDGSTLQESFEDEVTFVDQMLNLLLTKFLFVSNDYIYVKYNYNFDVYLTLKPFKILKYDPKFNSKDIKQLLALYLACIDEFEICLVDSDDYFMHRWDEKSGFGIAIEYYWIIGKDRKHTNRLEIYKAFKQREQSIYCICQRGTLEDIKDYLFVQVNGKTGVPHMKEYTPRMCIEKLMDMP